jgi:hypothetical protein
MIAIVELVVVIFLGWKQLRKFCEKGSFGLLSSKTVLKQLKSAICAKSFQEKVAHILLLCTLSLPLAPSPNGE